MLTTTEDNITVNPGVVCHEGKLYLTREPQLIHYTPTNTTQVLNIMLHDQVQTGSFVTCEMELAFTEGAPSEACYLELYRFKLQPDARLRYTYTSFAGRETEYDILNIIHALFCGMGRPTPSSEITAHFVRKALTTGADGADAFLCMILLSSKKPVQAEALEVHIQSGQGADLSYGDNLRLYQELTACLKQFNGDRQTASAKRKSWSVMMD